MIYSRERPVFTFMSKSYKTSIQSIIFCNTEVSANQYPCAIADHSYFYTIYVSKHVHKHLSKPFAEA